MLVKNAGQALVGPYKFIRINLLFSTVRSAIIHFPSSSAIYLCIVCSKLLPNKTATPLELDLPELKIQSFFRCAHTKLSLDLIKCTCWRQ